VFLTFSLSMAGMFRMSVGSREPERRGKRWAALFGFAFLLCATILVVTSYEKFAEGGWLTLVVTSGFSAVCFLVHRHYAGVGRLIAKLDHDMSDLEPVGAHKTGKVDPDKPTAVILVGGYGGLGIATLLGVLRQFRGHFKGVVFVSAGIVDSGAFKGQEEMEALRASVEATVHRYVDLARNLGLPAAFRYSVGTDAVEELERLCVAASKTFTDATFFAGKLVFRAEHWYHRWLHNETAIAVQKRLQVHGLTMVVLPKLVD
jgi:K+ transporter